MLASKMSTVTHMAFQRVVSDSEALLWEQWRTVVTLTDGKAGNEANQQHCKQMLRRTPTLRFLFHSRPVNIESRVN